MKNVILDSDKNYRGLYYFPINVHQVENLLGKILTQVESTNLREEVQKATKDVMRQNIWQWFDSVQENSITSWKLCIGPIEVDENPKNSGDQVKDSYTWLTEAGEVGKPTYSEDSQSSK